MQLYLVRHGEAVEEKDDPQQPLSPKGIADMDRLARYLRDSLDLKVGAFYHSPKKRAAQSCAIIKNTIYPAASLQEKDYLNPNDPVDRIVQDIAGWNDNTMIVGHLPFLNHLAGRLTTGDAGKLLLKLPTSSIAVLERDSQKRWYIAGLVHLGMILDE